jgi:pimeloyl-ACP methyl ester carboxylesterase
MKYLKLRYALVPIGLLSVGGMFGFFLALASGPAEPTPGVIANRDGSSNENSLFTDLADGYHESLTRVGQVRLPKSGPIDRQQLAMALGAPESCSKEPSSPMQSRVETRPEGDLYRFSGEVECDGFSLPWDTLVGIPEAKNPKGVLILVHGTAGSPEQLFGIQTGSYHPDYMNQSGLAGLSDGFVVIAPRILTDLVYDNESGYNYLRNRVDRRAMALGLRLLGMEQVALSHLLKSVTNELGVQDLSQVIYGVSLGGLVAFYQAALNPEIDAVIVSQWAEDRFEKLASPSYPDAMWLFESGDYSIISGSAYLLRDREVAKLIFPRPFGIEVGEEDPRAVAMDPLVEALSDLYSDYPQRFQVTINPGGHEMRYFPVVGKIWPEVE